MNPEELAEAGEPRDHRDFNALMGFCRQCLEKQGYPEESAEASAFALVEADARGTFSHGAAGGTGLEEALERTGESGAIDMQATPQRLAQKYPTIGVIDACGAPGHYTSRLAIEWVRELAGRYGTAKIWVFNANHFGAAGIWAEEISRDKSFLAHVTCTTSSTVRFLGHDNDGVDFTKGAAVGARHRLGTNPDAYCIPYREGCFTIDMANTELAASLCFKYSKEGWAAGRTRLLKIPNYVADENYRPTLDPMRVATYRDGRMTLQGSVFPLGGLRGYKGQIMLQRIEGDLCFGGGPIHAVETGSKASDRRISQSFEAQAVDFLYTREEALERMAQLMRDWSAYAGPGTRMPGERSHLARAYSLRHGIPYSDDQIETLRRCGRKVGIDLDQVPASVKPYPRNLFTK